MWRNCGEGPWDTELLAVRFADAEVGMPYRTRETDDGWIIEVDDHDADMPKVALPPLPDDLTCPSCGNDQMLFIEDISCARKVRRFYPNDTLVIAGQYETNGFDEGTNPRFQCSSCCREFAMTGDDVEIDFV